MAAVTTPLSERLHHLADEGTQHLHQALDRGETLLEDARDKARAEARALRSQVDDLRHAAADHAAEAARSADRQLHAHPYAAIGLAAGLALLAGFLLGRR